MYLYSGLHILGHDIKFFLWITSQNIWKILSVSKESTWNTGDPGSIPGLGRSLGEGKGYPLQYSGLENSMDFIVHGVSKSQTQLSDFHFHYLIYNRERDEQRKSTIWHLATVTKISANK